MTVRSRAVRAGLVLAAAGTFLAVPGLNASAHSTLAGPPWTVGVSNSTINNGWRDEMVCSIRAELHHSGKAKSDVQQTNGDTAGQISQIKNMISKGDQAIIIDPNSTTALNPTIQQATARGIKVVVVDQTLNVAGVHQVANNQRAYGRLGMQWLVNQIHHKGNVVLMEGISGAPANTAREQGQQDVLKHNPNVKVIAKVYTNWDPTKGSQQITDLLNSGKKIDGVWTSGIDYVVVSAYQHAQKKFVPVVGADNNEFVHQLATLKGKGLTGAAVTNPPPVGAAGASVALKLLQGGSAPAVTLLKPAVWANTSAAGLAQLKAHHLPSQGPAYGAAWNLQGFTNYTKQELFTCNTSW
jgi:ribose transport system substrate-binding protein